MIFDGTRGPSVRPFPYAQFLLPYSASPFLRVKISHLFVHFACFVVKEFASIGVHSRLSLPRLSSFIPLPSSLFLCCVPIPYPLIPRYCAAPPANMLP